MSKFIDLTGQKFGRLKVVKRVENLNNRTAYLCKCDCGKTKVITGKALKNGNTKSCGCLHKEISKNVNTKHGLINTRLYNIWKAIKNRCYCVSNIGYSLYGGRGIIMCDEWFSNFLNFYNWAISNCYQENLSIDRINVNGNYEPNNCRWVNNYTQANNTRKNNFITFNSKTQTIAQWAKEFNMPYARIYARINKLNWPIEKALTCK